MYAGDPAVKLVRTVDVERGDAYTVSWLEMGAHTGTHVDAPAHFVRGGKTVEQLNLGVLMGPARVVEMLGVDREITRRDLASASIPTGTERILFRTKNSSLWSLRGFQKVYAGLAADGADWLVERGVRLVGIDYLSVEPFGSTDYAAHHILLDAGVVIVEGVNLDGVAEGVYELICLPLRIAGAEGAPARAVLIRE